MKNTIQFIVMLALCFLFMAAIAQKMLTQSDCNKFSTDGLEYGLILNRDYTITVIDLETDERTVSTIDSLGYHINKLQE